MIVAAEKVADNDGQPGWLFAGQPKDATGVECPLGPHVTCGFFLFESTWNRDDLRALIASMIGHGCVSMMFHGARCEEAHDLADDVFVDDGYDENFGGREDTLMTTWAENESIL